MRVCKVIATLIVAFVMTNASFSIAQNGPPPTPLPPTTVSSAGTIADANEPGERLEISGQVFSPDGVTPAPDVIVYAYQTDATGEYHNDPKTHVARLHGWAKTDAQGRYTFHTIKPASYPRMTIPAHVHFHVWGPGFPLQWTPELQFAGDKYLKPDQIAASKALGNFANVQPLQAGQDGALHCTFNIRISTVSNSP